MIKKEIVDFIKNTKNDWIKLRHYFHQHPEVSMNEINTASKIKDYLTRFGFEVKEFNKSGIVGILRNGTSNKKIALRVAINGIEIKENNESIPYYSLNNNMHASGNDGQIAMLLATCQYFATNKNFDGSLYVIFQPDQEKAQGAISMLKDGFFDEHKIDKIFAIQNISGNFLPKGEVGDFYFYDKDDAFMPSNDMLEYAILGKNHYNAFLGDESNPIIVGTSIVANLEKIIFSKLKPFEKVLISFGAFNAGKEVNLISSTCSIKLSVKTFDENIRKKVLGWIDEIIFKTCEMYSCFYSKQTIGRTNVLINNSEVNSSTKKLVQSIFGPNKVKSVKKSLISDDYAMFLEKIPGCLVFINNGDLGSTYTNNYNFNDGIMPYGIAYFISVVEHELASQTK